MRGKGRSAGEGRGWVIGDDEEVRDRNRTPWEQTGEEVPPKYVRGPTSLARASTSGDGRTNESGSRVERAVEDGEGDLLLLVWSEVQVRSCPVIVVNG